MFRLQLLLTTSVCVMVSELIASAVDRGLELRSDQTRDYKIGLCSASPLSSQSKDWLAGNQGNFSEWSHMSNRGPLF